MKEIRATQDERRRFEQRHGSIRIFINDDIVDVSRVIVLTFRLLTTSKFDFLERCSEF